MLRIEVSGGSQEEKTEMAKLIEKTLKIGGVKVLRITGPDESPTVPVSNPLDVVIMETASRTESTELDFCIGRSEAAAYELAQDAGYRVRITNRDKTPMVVTRDYDVKRVNFEVRQHIVVSWHLG